MRALAGLVLLAGCGGSDGPPPPGADADTDSDSDSDSDADTDGDTDTGTEPPWDTLELVFGPYDLAGGEQRDFCEWFDLETDAPTNVVRFSQTNGGYAHHFNLHAASFDHEPGEGACPDFIGAFVDSRTIYPGTRDQGPAVMPAGVAYVLEAGQQMFFNLHLFNGGDEPVTDTVRVDLDIGDPSREWIPAGTVALTSLTIEIPPRSDGSATTECPYPVDVNLISMTSHTHGRSTLVTANLYEDGIAGEEIYRSDTWADPAIAQFDPALFIPRGTGITATCEYSNPDDRTIVYGGTADDEMCFVFGHYFPGPALLPCID